jgi:adenylate kinase
MATKPANLIIVFLGAPGAGKGTQAAFVAKELGLKHISSGDMFRRAVERADEIGCTVRAYMEKGALVPDEITSRMVLGELLTSGRGIILDGFPRNVKQAQALDEALKPEGRTVKRVIYIKVTEAELLRRLSNRWLCKQCQAPFTRSDKETQVLCNKCSGELYQRTDDQPETVIKRLGVYFSETAPLIDYYTKQGKLSEIDGQGEIHTITRRIVSSLAG